MNISKINNSADVFQRYEKKYRMSAEQYEQFIPNILNYMEMDAYGKHTICNVYLDTEDFSLIRTSIEKPLYKEKLRLRSYGIPDKNDTVFLELKKKFDKIVYKRRVALPLEVAVNYLNAGIYPAKYDCQILRELDFAISKYHTLPKVFLSYERRAFFGKEDSNLRLTIDEHIIGRNYNVDLESGVFGTSVLNPKEFLMEIKIPGVMPLWLSRLLSELSIFPTSFSKYGTYYTQLYNTIPEIRKHDFHAAASKYNINNTHNWRTSLC